MGLRPRWHMSQAARLLGLRTAALRRWIDTTYAPVIREGRTGTDTVTWGEFVEAGYLREYRAKQVTPQYLRPVIAILREELGVRYPLATRKPYTSGRSLALTVQKQVGLDPSLGIVVLGRDGSPTPCSRTATRSAGRPQGADPSPPPRTRAAHAGGRPSPTQR